jgi:hypothetical protein
MAPHARGYSQEADLGLPVPISPFRADASGEGVDNQYSCGKVGFLCPNLGKVGILRAGFRS